MFARRRRTHAAQIGLATAFAAAACAGSHAVNSTSPPHAEFLLGSADSTFWVSTVSGTLRVRGAPLVLAHYGNRFFELYSADEDQSYNDALLVGERLYRRDLITGDSTAVFSDTAVAHVAGIYARTHPDARPLGPDEDGEPNPQTSATAQLDILDVFGPFLSYEYHVDIELPGKAPWHSTRRGVLDLRTGKQSDAADLFGASRAREVVAGAQRTFETMRDSAIRARQKLSGDDQKAVAALEHRHFDPVCFALENIDGRPAITFGIPGAGEGNDGNIVELDPIPVDSVGWWRDASAGLARRDSLDDDRWTGSMYTVIARYDTSGQFAQLSLADSSRREWPVGPATGPLRRIDWLDHPAPSDVERKALRRAFDQAARYDESARVAVRVAPKAGVSLAAFRPSAPVIRHARGVRSSVREGSGPTRIHAARHPTR